VLLIFAAICLLGGTER